MTQTLPRNAARLPAWVLFSVLFCYVAFLPLGLAALVRLRLELTAVEMRGAFPFLLCGGLAGLWAQRWIQGRGASRTAKLNLIGWCNGVLAGLALLTLGLSSTLDAAVLCAALGVPLGLNSVVTPAYVFQYVQGGQRWIVCGGALGAVLLAVKVPGLGLERPEGILGLSTLVFGITGWIAWSRQHDAGVVTDP